MKQQKPSEEFIQQVAERRKKEFALSEEESRELILEHQECYHNPSLESDKRMIEIEYLLSTMNQFPTAKSISKGKHQKELDSSIKAQKQLGEYIEKCGGREAFQQQIQQNTNNLLYGTPIEQQANDEYEPKPIFKVIERITSDDNSEEEEVLGTFKTLNTASKFFDKQKQEDGEALADTQRWEITLEEHEYDGDDPYYSDQIDILDSLTLFSIEYQQHPQDPETWYTIQSIWNAEKQALDKTILDDTE